jgi:predicted kinase
MRVGIYKGATDVHHVIRHGGDREKFVTSPLISLCHECHSRRTLGEVSGRDGVREDYYPQLFAPIPLTVYMVCGPPASGKTRYIESHRKHDDIVIDLDVIIAEFTRQPIYTRVDQDIVREGIRIRNKRLESLQNVIDKGQSIWYIVGAPDPRDRAIWKELLTPKMVYIILTPAVECFERIDKDNRRMLVSDDQKRAVTRWFEKYQPLEGEEIIYDYENDTYS